MKQEVLAAWAKDIEYSRELYLQERLTSIIKVTHCI